MGQLCYNRKMNIRAYQRIIHKDQDSCFGVSFPNFPGCFSAGDTLEEAHAMADEALAFHIEGMIEDGEVIPEPPNPPAPTIVIYSLTPQT